MTALAPVDVREEIIIMPVSISEETIEELAHSVNAATNGLETGRRVGWAKAFDAMRRADNAERDFNVMAADRDILANFGARAFGALTVMLDQAVDELFRGDHHELRSFFPDGPFHAGQDAARRLASRGLVAAAVVELRAEIVKQQAYLDLLRQETDELKTTRKVALSTEIRALKKEQGELRDATERARRASKRRVLGELFAEFGFADNAAFFGYLAEYRNDTLS
jgi:hypothetical protein